MFLCCSVLLSLDRVFCVLRDLVGIADVFYFLIWSCFGVFILYGFDLPVSVIFVRKNWDSKVLDSLGRLLLFRCWRVSLGELFYTTFDSSTSVVILLFSTVPGFKDIPLCSSLVDFYSILFPSSIASILVLRVLTNGLCILNC